MSAAKTRRGRRPRAPDIFPVPLNTPPMEAQLVNDLPAGDGEWQYEPKWDGFRCLVFKASETIELRSKSGKPLGRYFPEVVSALAKIPDKTFVLDGELTIAVDGQLSFDALQMRLHPAESRIKRLAIETPAHLILFDMLADTTGEVLLDLPLRERRSRLERFLKRRRKSWPVSSSPTTLSYRTAESWLQQAGGTLTE